MGNFLSKAKSALTGSNNDTVAAEESKMGSPLAFSHYAKAQSSFKPPLIANENAFLGDVYSSENNDSEKPISCGFYRLEKGTPLVYTYTYHEMKIILEGEFDISDETGQSVHVSDPIVFLEYFMMPRAPAGSFPDSLLLASLLDRNGPARPMPVIALFGFEQYYS